MSASDGLLFGFRGTLVAHDAHCGTQTEPMRLGA